MVWKELRMAVLLIGICIVWRKPTLRAEVKFYINPDDPTIKDDINIVRERAHCTEFYTDKVTIGDIMDERARELFFEEWRNVELTAYLSVWLSAAERTSSEIHIKWKHSISNPALILKVVAIGINVASRKVCTTKALLLT